MSAFARALLPAFALVLCACVTTGTHEKALADLKAQRDDELAQVKAQDGKEKADLSVRLDSTEAARKELEQKLADAQKRSADLAKLLEGTSGEKAKLDQLLASTNQQLADLAKQKAAAEARAAVYKKLTTQLRSMIDGGKLSVKIRKGRMLITLPNDVLFESGSAKLKKAGHEAVAQVAAVLATLSDRQFLVAGHTDDKPIRSARFPSNWELLTERAVDVVRTLISEGMKPEALGALGYGEFDPVVPNDSDEHRAQNRRIEIQLQANLSELPAISEVPE